MANLWGYLSIIWIYGWSMNDWAYVALLWHLTAAVSSSQTYLSFGLSNELPLFSSLIWDHPSQLMLQIPYLCICCLSDTDKTLTFIVNTGNRWIKILSPNRISSNSDENKNHAILKSKNEVMSLTAEFCRVFWHLLSYSDPPSSLFISAYRYST